MGLEDLQHLGLGPFAPKFSTKEEIKENAVKQITHIVKNMKPGHKLVIECNDDADETTGLYSITFTRESKPEDFDVDAPLNESTKAQARKYCHTCGATLPNHLPGYRCET